ncbi:MAG TPA: hypothetical protein VLB47_15130 [Solirubrobacteraceae bacterium]|nr:hypothetical protein [Solirubrobacteraceae bacterium]
MLVRPDLEDALRAATRAPTPHGRRPWRFRLRGDVIELLAHRARRLPVGDPEDRELTIACGSALAVLLLGLRCAGLGTDVCLCAGRGEPDLLARVTLTGDVAVPSAHDRELLAALDRPGTPGPDPRTGAVARDLIARLQSVAAAEGAWLAPAGDDAARARLALIVTEGARRQASDAALRAERWARLEAGEPGGDGDAEAFFVGVDRRRTGRGAAEGAALLAVLGTSEDAPVDWMRAGRALASVWLEARAAGLRTGHLDQPVEIAALRARVAAAVGARGAPQSVLGFEHASAPLLHTPA